MGLVWGAVVGGLAVPALLSPLHAGDEVVGIAALSCAILGGVIEAISEWQHRRRAARFQRLFPDLKESPNG